MSEQLKGGKTLAEMGYLKFQGFKEACWNPIKLSAWLIEFKLEPEAKYDYDLAEQRKIRMGLVNINNQKRKAINEKRNSRLRKEKRVLGALYCQN